MSLKTLSLLRSARLAVCDGHRVEVICTDEPRRQELAAEYRRLFPRGPAPKFKVILTAEQ